MLRTLRPGRATDRDALFRLEERCFEGDRFSRRQLAHLLTRANALSLLAVSESEQVIGYGTLLFRRNSRMARLYSFCVDPEARGSGLGRELLEALEVAARERECTRLVLEVRADNRVAMGLYRRMGFMAHHWIDDYYADGCAAWRMDKDLAAPASAAESQT
ncbi:N-acetyltransferase [Salinicola endophyticus]|uniref:N-acetyltransferase n=1 Tax=Salinicola endophyticus TaxID=1949083 RepID=A0ABY8FI82_9GAMM|nr:MULTISPECIES: N-acetyltransferase [Salinicola]WFF42515.1 N-acetyltransferase [Salinicola endophyticus]